MGLTGEVEGDRQWRQETALSRTFAGEGEQRHGLGGENPGQGRSFTGEETPAPCCGDGVILCRGKKTAKFRTSWSRELEWGRWRGQGDAEDKAGASSERGPFPMKVRDSVPTLTVRAEPELWGAVVGGGTHSPCCHRIKGGCLAQSDAQ